VQDNSQFARETRVARVADQHWQGEIVPGWRIGEVPNGGYLLAIAARVLRDALPHPDPLTINAFYLAPAVLGPVDCFVQVLRAGRTSSQAVVALHQHGEIKVQVTAVFTDLAMLSGPSMQLEQRPSLPEWNHCLAHRVRGVELRERVEMRFAGSARVFHGGQPDASGCFDSWIRWQDGSDPDLLSLLVFADALPPPAFTLYGPVAWVPTLELSVQLRAHPAPGLIQGRLRTRFLTHGVMEEDGEYWDSTGRLVALSRQTAKIRLPRDADKAP